MKVTKSACALFAGLFVLMQGALPVRAASGGLSFSEGEIVPDRPCSVTIREYVSNNGDAGAYDGNSSEIYGMLPDGARPMPDVGFSYMKIAEIQDTDGASKSAYRICSSAFSELISELKVKGSDNSAACTADEIMDMVSAANATSEPSVRSLVSGVGERMPDTDEDGESCVMGLSQGIYLFAETKSPEGVIPSSPFCVALPQTNISELTCDGQTYAPGEVWVYDLTVYPKSRSVSIMKKIIESGSGESGLNSAASVDGIRAVDQTSACIGDAVTFRVTSDVPKVSSDTKNRLYTIEDTMSEGLTLTGSLHLSLGEDEESAVPLTEKSDYKWSMTGTGESMGDSSGVRKITVNFTKKGLARLDCIDAASHIYMEYSAVLGKDAVLAGGGNVNAASLICGTDHSEDTRVASNPVAVYTYKLNLTKTFSPEIEHFAKVKFSVKKDGEKMYFVRESDGIYHVACPDEADEETDMVSPNDLTGILTVKGLASATYFITEEETADDYSLLKESIELTVRNKNVGMSVENSKSIDLVHTGGRGLVLIFTASSALMLAGVMLICYARKKS